MTTRSMVRSLLFCGAALALAIAGSKETRADITTASPGLPPTGQTYNAAGNPIPGGQPGYYSQYHAEYDNSVVLRNGDHHGFSNINITFSSGNEYESFQSILTGLVSVNGSPYTPFTLTGSVDITVFGRTSNTETGTFNTQMTSMDMTGTVLGNSVAITLDPTLGSTTGSTTITPITTGPNAGRFNISSFFDVYTEISINSGAPIGQTNGPTVVNLQSVPEPSTWILWLAGAMVPAYAG